MKRAFTLFLLLLSVRHQAQTILTKAFNEPVDFDMYTMLAYDSSGVIPKGSSGAQTWNFSSCIPRLSSFYVDSFAAKARNPLSGNFYWATLAESKGSLFKFDFLKTSATSSSVEVVGKTTFLNSGYTYTNSLVRYKWPFSFGAVLSDNFSGPAFGGNWQDYVTGTFTSSASGLGNLILPGGNTYSGVLQVTNIQTTYYYVYSTSGNFMYKSVETSYEYYHSSEKFPMVRVMYRRDSASTTNSSSIFINQKVINDVHKPLPEDEFCVWPNPINDMLNLKAPAGLHVARIRVLNMTGALVTEHPFGEQINLAELPAGYYFIELPTSIGIIRKKIIKS